MKHRILGKKLSRNFNERKALWTSQIRSVFIYGKIKTTSAKAKSVLPFIEKLASDIITKPELIIKRDLFRYLQDQTWVNNVYSEFKKIFGTQTSNFTKITNIKRRYGDDALIVELAFIKPITFLQKKVKPTVTKPAAGVKSVSKKTKKETKNVK